MMFIAGLIVGLIFGFVAGAYFEYGVKVKE